MKFLQIIEHYEKSLVNEMDNPPPVMAPPPDGPSSPPAPAPVPPTSEEPIQVDEPAGIATMGNLLKKALTLKLDDDAKYKVSQLPEINEKNASEVINQLIAIMKTYSSDIDIETP
jgi:hypothetical protein